MNKIGKIKEIAGIKWRILDKTEQGYLAVTEEPIKDKMFDNNSNDWKISKLRKFLNTEFRKKLEDAGVKLVEFERDLISLDGQTEYGTCKDYVSLLEHHEYQKYRKYLPNLDEWWWLLTPWSTPCNGWKYSVTVVAPSGRIFNDDFDNFYGVRPVCIFPSSIFES